MTQQPLPTVSLDDLIAVNDEIAALVRAGVPLERGLLDTSRDVGGRLGKIIQTLSERIGRGATLSEALADDGDRIPPVYRAIVEAGLRSGRLASALEGMATSAKRIAELRQMLGMALIYPFVVLCLAYGLLILFVTTIVPVIHEMVVDSRLPVTWLLDFLTGAGQSVNYWWPIVPGLILLVGLWWLASSRATVLGPSPTTLGLNWIPWVRGAAASGRSAGLAEVLALLIEHGVPLPEGLRLAGRASGDGRILRETERMACAAERGEPLWKDGRTSSIFPPLLRWLMASGGHGLTLAKALRNAAQIYHRRAGRQADVARVFLPAILTIIIGGGATLCLALCLYLPFVEMLTKVAGG